MKNAKVGGKAKVSETAEVATGMGAASAAKVATLLEQAAPADSQVTSPANLPGIAAAELLAGDSARTRAVESLVADALVCAGSTFSDDKKRAYERAIENESNPQARWVLEQVLKNAQLAQENRSPLCDDTGIPHLLLEVGSATSLPAGLFDAIQRGVCQGLRMLPGRPMAVLGTDEQRLAQSAGISDDPAALEPAPLVIQTVPGSALRLHVLMFGGGPAIRGKTQRIFHQHSAQVVEDELVEWAKQSVRELGCSPCVLAIGVGRSAFEASSLMLQAQAFGNFDVQSDLEQRITERVNQAGIGALGLGGDTSVLASFIKVGPQRASGVRIACLRPCCCFEPRHAVVDLLGESKVE